jgi:hypothetical protein
MISCLRKTPQVPVSVRCSPLPFRAGSINLRHVPHGYKIKYAANRPRMRRPGPQLDAQNVYGRFIVRYRWACRCCSPGVWSSIPIFTPISVTIPVTVLIPGSPRVQICYCPGMSACSRDDYTLNIAHRCSIGPGTRSPTNAARTSDPLGKLSPNPCQHSLT